VENYSDALRKAARELGLTEQEQNALAALSLQRNRLAHRYLNFRWQTIRAFSDKRELIARVASLLLRKAEE